MDIETESELIKQEHRLWRIWENFISRKARYSDPNDPRRAACVTAFCWNMFFSPTTVAATGGLVATVTIGLLWWQNQLLQENNSLIAKSISPEQQYVVSASDQFHITRTITEGNEHEIKETPLGVGSVLHADATISCSGNSPFMIEELGVDLTFGHGGERRTVQFLLPNSDSMRQVVRPGDIVVLEIKLLPAISGDEEVLDMTAQQLQEGDFCLWVSGRDVMGIEWWCRVESTFATSLVRSRPSIRMDSISASEFVFNDIEVPEDVSRRLDLPKGNPNRIVGTHALVYGLQTSETSGTRLVERLSSHPHQSGKR